MALALALSFVNMGLRALVVRADTLHRLLERLKDKLPVWMRPREASGGGDPNDRRHTYIYICMHATFTPPHLHHTSLVPRPPPASRRPQGSCHPATMQLCNHATM